MSFDYTTDIAADHSADDVASAFAAARKAGRAAVTAGNTAFRKLGIVLNAVARSGVAVAHAAHLAEEGTADFSEDSLETSATAFGRDELGVSKLETTRARKYARVLGIWEAAGFPTKVAPGAVRGIPADATDAQILAIRERIATDHGDKVTGSTVTAAAIELGIVDAPEAPEEGTSEGVADADQTDDEATFADAANVIITMMKEGFVPSPTVRKALVKAIA